MLGLPEDAALKCTLEDLVAPESAAVADALMQRPHDAPNDRIEVEVVDAIGQRITLELDVQPMFEHQEHVRFKAIARDITERKRVESALREAPATRPRRPAGPRASSWPT